MISARQQEANARNAQRSTGPATEAGRTRSAKNATTHGLTTTGSALLESEDAEAYARHIAEYRANHMPQNEQQAFFVTQLTEAAWRLRRVRKFENGILNADPTLAIDTTLDKVCKLNRYEASIERSYYRAFRELQARGHAARNLVADVAGALGIGAAEVELEERDRTFPEDGLRQVLAAGAGIVPVQRLVVAALGLPLDDLLLADALAADVQPRHVVRRVDGEEKKEGRQVDT